MNILLVKEITNISAITKKKFKAMGMIRFDCLADVNVPENKMPFYKLLLMIYVYKKI